MLLGLNIVVVTEAWKEIQERAPSSELVSGLRHMPAPDILNRLGAGGQAQDLTARSAQYCTVFEACQTPRLSSVHKLVSTSDCHFGSGLPGRGAQ